MTEIIQCHDLNGSEGRDHANRLVAPKFSTFSVFFEFREFGRGAVRPNRSPLDGVQRPERTVSRMFERTGGPGTNAARSACITAVSGRERAGGRGARHGAAPVPLHVINSFMNPKDRAIKGEDDQSGRGFGMVLGNGQGSAGVAGASRCGAGAASGNSRSS